MRHNKVKMKKGTVEGEYPSYAVKQLVGEGGAMLSAWDTCSCIMTGTKTPDSLASPCPIH